MQVEKSGFVIKEILKRHCCSHGWCYGVFWGFDLNSLVLKIKDAYFEDQMEALVHNMLLQVHVLGGGLIGQTAFTNAHQWMHLGQHSLGSFQSFDVFQDDSELYCQFSVGIKTIALISIQPWGVVQLGSTQKIPQTNSFVDQVKGLFSFSGMDASFGNKHTSDSNRFIDYSYENFFSLTSTTVPCSDGSLQSLPSTSEHQSRNSHVKPPDQLDHRLFQQGNCSDHLAYLCLPTFEALENVSSLRPSSHESCQDTLLDRTDFCQAQTQPEFLTWEELSLESGFPEAASTYEVSGWLSPQPGWSSVPFSSVQSSVTDAFGVDTMYDRLGIETAGDGDEMRLGWNDEHATNTLFSKLGLDNYLNGGEASVSCFTSADSRFEHLSFSSSSPNGRIVQDLPQMHFNEETKSVNQASDHVTTNIELNSKATKKTAFPSVVDDGNKTGKLKRKAKPGTKPRPKDRQMIQDRLAELRKLIPNGDKVSIDRLLERTAVHLNMMQSLTKLADILKQIEEPKSVENRTRPVNNDGGGVTWACEVDDQTMVCPLKVEDLGAPGQMLIEILCAEQGLFLEMVDVIRGFGLVILKGVMESRGTNKTWARFLVVVEGAPLPQVTRRQVFYSLVRILQRTGQSQSVVLNACG